MMTSTLGTELKLKLYSLCIGGLHHSSSVVAALALEMDDKKFIMQLLLVLSSVLE